jgi:RNA polymerase sigma factor (sigma-70 family)
MEVVRRVARSLWRRLPAELVDLEEVEADGFEGLVRARQAYDPVKGPLIPYIVLRSRGAMIDGLRRRQSNQPRDGTADAEHPLLSLTQELCEGLRVEDLVVDVNAPSADDVIERLSSPSPASELAELPQRCRRIAFARFILNRPRHQVAAAEGISSNTVAKYELRIRRRLRGIDQHTDETSLTPKELKVLRLAAEGASSDETAKRLRKAYETVKAQRRAIIAKLCARNMANAVAIGYQRGLLE